MHMCMCIYIDDIILYYIILYYIHFLTKLLASPRSLPWTPQRPEGLQGPTETGGGGGVPETDGGAFGTLQPGAAVQGPWHHGHWVGFVGKIFLPETMKPMGLYTIKY